LPINCHTYYSLRYGALSPEDMLAEQEKHGLDVFAVTDINCTAAILEFVRIAPRYNIKPIAGIDFRNGVRPSYIGIARNNNGYRELCDHLSSHLHSQTEYENYAQSFEDAFVIYPFENVLSWGKKRMADFYEINTEIFASEPERLQNISPENPVGLLENEFIGIRIQDIPALRFSSLKKWTHRMVILQPVTFRNKHDFNAHRLLRAIDNNTLLSKLSKSEEGSINDCFFTWEKLEQEFADFPEIILNTKNILESSSISFEMGSEFEHKNQKLFSTSTEQDNVLIENLCYEGLAYRYPDVQIDFTIQNGLPSGDKDFQEAYTLTGDDSSEVILTRIRKELAIIKEKGFVSYFLINWDITRYARERGYFYVGRGSGANSIVAYLLRITDVDPVELDLYFERFINLFRQNPPDFDIDFSWTERDDITQYIFSRYRNVALLGSFVTFQYSAVVRELGKVFGLPKHDIDMLSDRKFKMDQLDSMHRQVLYYAQYIHDFPNYISIHAAGILITERSVHSFGATFMPPKGYATTQFDMHQAEDVGINKLDILSQRGLGKIKDTLEIIAYNQPDKMDFDIHDIARFKQDEKCNELLRTAQAIGCFYVESPAMRMLLTKLQTHNYLGLVAASSVIRPGVASSGMMRQYILRERIPEKRKEAPAALLELMPETYGVMVYQEDVIKVAHYFAGLSLGEADVLRRGMSGKFRGREEFERARIAFHQNAVAKGNPEKMVEEVWRQVESFAGYAFAKGHSASYAVESYQCLFLKAYFPLEYMTATINNYGGFYRTEIYVHEARMHGAKIEAPCVNTSGHGAVIKDKTLFLGLEIIRSLNVETRDSIIQARQEGLFESLDDFLDRVKISLEQCVLLARMNAFRFTGLSKKKMLWQLHFKLNKSKTTQPEPRLFFPPRTDWKLPDLEHHWLEDAYDELELIGFPLCNPFELLGEEMEDELYVKEFHNQVGKNMRTVGYLTTLKPTRTANGKPMFFGTFLDRKGHFIDTVHFPPVAEKYSVSGWGLFLIEGKVMEEFDALTIEVSMIRKMKLLSDPRLEDTPSHPALDRKNTGNDKWMNKYFEKA
jgi:DNA-directed DNA polymerase III PolC